jgi:uncharacterized protein (DUF2062 family)
VSLIGRWYGRVRGLWHLALEENRDPRAFARAVAVGTIVSALPVPPAFGLRFFGAIVAAWIARCSKLTAYLASHVFVLPLWVGLAVAEVRLGSLILRRPPPVWGTTASAKLEAAQRALLAWWIGGVLVAPLFGLVAYVIALLIARRYRARRDRARSPSTA